MPTLFVFVALTCEAKPLIKHWQLKKIPEKHPFTVYANEQRILIITGVGQIAMAGAVAYALGLFQARTSRILLNIGIAGHRKYELGSLFLADKILNGDSGKSFYPQFPFQLPCETALVQTCSSPQTHYVDGRLYDMEAAAFYEIAVKFTTSELIHSMKIVSDNSYSSIYNISEIIVEHWIEQSLAEINNLIAQMAALASSLKEADVSTFLQLTSVFHFSATNSVKLKSLLQSWQVINPHQELNWCQADAKNGKELIVWLEKLLERQDFYL